MVRRGNWAIAFLAITLMLALTGCGNDPESSAPSPSEGGSTTLPDLAAIACATDDPTDVGELTGAWRGSEGGIYYIRQVGDCVWWFGTDVMAIEPGLTDQNGFANVASGRVRGTQVDIEWADLPLGDTMGGGGLTFVYDEESDQLVMTEQRGDWQPFGGSTLTRIGPSASPNASPSSSASP